MGTIVVGYDGSDCAQAALSTALDVARALGDDIVVAFGFEANPVGGEAIDYWRALREHGESVLAQAAARAQAAGVSVESVVMEEAPAQALADLARERDARVIVVGTNGEGPLRGALLGAVPHKLLHLADRPVLVVPAP